MSGDAAGAGGLKAGPELPPGMSAAKADEARKGAGDGAGATSSGHAGDASSLFWGGGQPEDFENHPDFLAMQAAMDEFTPFEEAEAWKKEGNDKLRIARKANYAHMKLRYYREAVGFYSLAIQNGMKDRENTPDSFLAICFNNRAQANILLTNFRSALDDAEESIRLNGASLKAYFRALKSALALRDAEKAESLAQRGKAVAEEGDAEFAELVREVTKLKQRLEAEKQREAEASGEALSTVVQFAVLLRQRGVKIGLPSFPDIGHKPYLDEEGVMHWPVIMVYPESGQVELIEDFPETSVFDPFLEMMFQEGGDSGLPWDERNEYLRPRMRLYYCTSFTETMPQDKLLKWLDGEHVGEQQRNWKKESWERIDTGALTLGQMLTKCVIPALPTVYAVTDNDFLKEFLNS